MAKKFIKLSKGSGGSADDRVKYVTYMDRGAELIKYPVIEGDTARDPVAKGYIEKPTKEPTESTVYTQDGWSKTDGGAPDSTALQNVTEDRTVYAAFTESARTFTVNFYDGDTLLKTEQVAYGGSSSYEYRKDGYIYGGWSPEPTNVTEDMDCYVQWVESIALADASWAEIAMIIQNGNGAKMWAVGDEKTVKVGYTTYTFVIAGFNEDAVVDSDTKEVVTFICKDVAPYSLTWGMSDKYYGASDVHSKLTELYDGFPSDLQAAIKTSKKKTINSTYSGVTDFETKLWSLSNFEMWTPSGTGLDSKETYTGKPYTAFTNSLLSGSASNKYWLRTKTYKSGSPYIVQANGTPTTQPNTSKASIRFGFCI